MVCDAFLNLFLVCLNKASFIAQRGVSEPLKPSPGYATAGQVFFYQRLPTDNSLLQLTRSMFCL